MLNSVDPDETWAHRVVSSGSNLFAKPYYYYLWQWKIKYIENIKSCFRDMKKISHTPTNEVYMKKKKKKKK